MGKILSRKDLEASLPLPAVTSEYVLLKIEGQGQMNKPLVEKTGEDLLFGAGAQSGGRAVRERSPRKFVADSCWCHPERSTTERSEVGRSRRISTLATAAVAIGILRLRGCRTKCESAPLRMTTQD